MVLLKTHNFPTSNEYSSTSKETVMHLDHLIHQKQQVLNLNFTCHNYILALAAILTVLQIERLNSMQIY